MCPKVCGLRRLQYTMSKVRKWDGEGTFAGTRDNDGVAPIDPMGVRIATGALPECGC